MHTLAMFQNLGWPEMLIILGLGVLLFGKRLPEVGRSIGKSIVEFKKGVRGITDEIEDSSVKKSDSPARSEPEKLEQSKPGDTIPQSSAPAEVKNDS